MDEYQLGLSFDPSITLYRTLEYYVSGLVPSAHFHGTFKKWVMQPINIGEDAVLILWATKNDTQHSKNTRNREESKKEIEHAQMENDTDKSGSIP